MNMFLITIIGEFESELQHNENRSLLKLTVVKGKNHACKREDGDTKNLGKMVGYSFARISCMFLMLSFWLETGVFTIQCL